MVGVFPEKQLQTLSPWCSWQDHGASGQGGLHSGGQDVAEEVQRAGSEALRSRCGGGGLWLAQGGESGP